VPLNEPLLVAISATVEPVTLAFLPTTVAVLSVKLVEALALLKSPAPPLSVCARIDECSEVEAASLTLPPAVIVMLLPSTCGFASSPRSPRGPPRRR
jgi:hypothetical protein